jgi:hypothetical protein
MRKSRYLLDRNLKGKFTARSIDEHSMDLNLTNPSLYHNENVTHLGMSQFIYVFIKWKNKRRLDTKKKQARRTTKDLFP